MTNKSTQTWEEFVDKWKGCKACPLHKRRNHIVIARGKIPCDICFVGEAPGKTEDDFGQPFQGPAGILLDQMIARALQGILVCKECRRDRLYNQIPCEQYDSMCQEEHSSDYAVPFRLGFTNLLCCIPWAEDDVHTRKPEHNEVMSCKQRLDEYMTLGKPKIIFAVGKIPYEYLEQGLRDSIKIPKGCYVQQIDHPAAILRAKVAGQSLMRKGVVANIRAAIRNHLGFIL